MTGGSRWRCREGDARCADARPAPGDRAPRRAACVSLILCLTVSGMVTAGGAPDSEAVAGRASLILVRGAPGAAEFGQLFDEWSSRWCEAAARGDVAVTVVGVNSETRPLDELQAAIAAHAEEARRPLWIVMIGHGTFDGRDAKFNLTGPDVSAEELAGWLEPIRRPLAVINCASASAPFLERLSRSGRVVMTATRSGHEVNFARFGDHLSRAIADLNADLDKDGQVSLLEAFLTASRHTHNWYDGRQQLSTEHALLDDNGDGRGVEENFFEGLLPVKAAEGGLELDGRRAHQWHFVPSDEERRFPGDLRPRRDELELEIALLRDRKASLDEAAYYAELERLLIELAELYEQADAQSDSRQTSPADSTP